MDKQIEAHIQAYEAKQGIPDRLATMFTDQLLKQKVIADLQLPADNPEAAAYFTLGLMSEIGEMLNEDKRWKDNLRLGIGDNSEGLAAAQNELIDCWLFLINLTLAMNVDADKLYEMFGQKSKVVWGRIN